MNKNANPQGKGLTPVMELVLAHRQFASIPAKNIERIAAELFTSLFILQSEFKFRVVIGQSYWLYQNQDTFRLSIIAPEEWNNRCFGEFVGECVMQNDLTWTLKVSEQAAKNTGLMQFIETKKTEFEQHLSQQTRVKDALPVYDAKLPFYQRVLANGLAYSLGISMEKSQIAQLDFKSAQRDDIPQILLTTK